MHLSFYLLIGIIAIVSFSGMAECKQIQTSTDSTESTETTDDGDMETTVDNRHWNSTTTNTTMTPKINATRPYEIARIGNDTEDTTMHPHGSGSNSVQKSDMVLIKCILYGAVYFTSALFFF